MAAGTSFAAAERAAGLASPSEGTPGAAPARRTFALLDARPRPGVRVSPYPVRMTTNESRTTPARALRLRRRGDFTRVLRRGRRARRGVVGVSAAPNDLGHPRMGLAVGRRVGNAVERNTVKRRLRVILRSLLVDEPAREGAPSAATRDVVVTAYEGAHGVPFARLRDDVRAAALASRALPGAPEGDGVPRGARHDT